MRAEKAFSSARSRGVSSGPHTLMFLQSSHLHLSVHLTDAWKHSQYFLRQCDFLQRQPRACAPTGLSCSSSTILGANALELRCLMLSTACCVSMASQSNSKHAPTTLTLVLLTRSRSGSCWPSLAQSKHLQPPQRSPAAKHSQYSFRQRDFLHEQMRFPPLLTCIMCSGVSESKAGVCGTGRLLDLFMDQIQRAVSSNTAASPEQWIGNTI